MNKRVVLILLPLAITLSVLAGIYVAVKPQIQSWLLGQINQISEERLPVHVRIENVDWSLLFPEIELSGVTISKKDFEMPTVTVQEVTASLDLIAILSGKIAISNLLLFRPAVEVELDSYLKDDKSPAQPMPLKDFFDFLKRIPLARLGLKESNISVSSKKMKTRLKLGSADMLVLRGRDRLSLQLDFSDSAFESEMTGNLPFRLQGDAIVNATSLDISNLKLGSMNTLVTVRGSIPDLPNVHIDPQGTFQFEVFSELEEIAKTGQTLFKIPAVQGKINSAGRIEISKNFQINSGFKFTGQKLKIDQFEIGDIQFQGSIDKNILKIPQIALTNEAGLVDIKDLIIDMQKKEIGISGKLLSEQVDLHELLIRLGIGSIPLEVFIGTQLNCSGTLVNPTLIECGGKATGQQLEVRTGETVEDILVQIDEFAANGKFSVTSKDIRYSADLQVGEDTGASDGVIKFKEGFKINYSSPRFQFKNLKTLAGLFIEGETEVQGSTEGNSDSAVFAMNLKTKDLFFENFYLGAPQGLLAYERSKLHFKNIEGQFPATHYQLNLDVDLKKKQLQTAGKISKFEINELLQIFQRLFTVPFTVTGTGSAEFNVEGPFQLGKLSYDLKASLNRGEIVGESFDSLNVALHSESGEMKIQNALLVKNKNEIRAQGISHPDGQIDIQVNARSFPIEHSENIAKLGSQLSGLVDLETKLTGPVLSPDIQLNGRLYQLVVEEQEFAESKFELDISKQSLAGKTNLFASQLLAQFKVPLSATGPFLLKLNAKNWNYTTLFALIGGGSLLNEYKASLTGDLDLSSDQGGLWKASGQGTIQNLLLQRGNLSLQNKLPMTLTMTDGTASLSNFKVEGDSTYFEAKGKRISYEELNLRLEGQAQLRLFQIFVPFLEELDGTANLAADVSGPLLKPEVLGSANVEGGFAKLKGFPHPFEKILANVQFSQSKILINKFTGALAGGNFDGYGSVVIEGPQNLPTSIKANLYSVNLNVPDRIRTSGDAEVVFSGNWFPFILSGTYHVQSGFMDKELTEEASSGNFKQSSYLPKVILQSAFEPVLLDLSIVLEEPLQIRNSLVEGAVSGNIIVKGAPQNPQLRGQLVAVKGTKAIFRDKIFEVQSANVRFNSDNEINPDLYVSARSRISEYDVNMLIQGKAKDPTVRLTSIPPLSDQDIISLIALGVTSQTLEKQVEAGQSAEARDKTMTGLVATALAQTAPFKQFQKTTGFEIQVSTSYDDTKKVSVQRFTLSKKLTDKVRAAATQTAGALSSQEYTLHYNFTDSLSAIGRYEDRKYNDNTGTITTTNTQNQSIFGIDLEFKREFK